MDFYISVPTQHFSALYMSDSWYADYWHYTCIIHDVQHISIIHVSFIMRSKLALYMYRSWCAAYWHYTSIIHDMQHIGIIHIISFMMCNILLKYTYHSWCATYCYYTHIIHDVQHIVITHIIHDVQHIVILHISFMMCSILTYLVCDIHSFLHSISLVMKTLSAAELDPFVVTFQNCHIQRIISN